MRSCRPGLHAARRCVRWRFCSVDILRVKFRSRRDSRLFPSARPLACHQARCKRRPDVIAAWRRVGAAFNRVQQARAARLPDIDPDGKRLRSHERSVRAQGSRPSRVGHRRILVRTALSRRRTQGPGRGAHWRNRSRRSRPMRQQRSRRSRMWKDRSPAKRRCWRASLCWQRL